MKLSQSLLLFVPTAVSAFHVTHRVTPSLTTTSSSNASSKTSVSSRLHGLADDELESAIQRSVSCVPIVMTMII
jgi:hypothetical protein